MALGPAMGYEDLLGDGLQALLSQGTDSLDDFVGGLNQRNVRSRTGKKWTADVLAGELERLAPKPGEEGIWGSGITQRKVVGQPFPPQPQTAEELLKTGLLNLWYIVARSLDVTDRPVALGRLSRNIVLWRDDAGTLNVVEDYCPHRGAPLSLGAIFNGNLACAYHGVEVNGEGVIAAVPPTVDCPLVGQRAIKAYPSREFGGMIYVYFGDDAHTEPPEPILPDEITSPEWSSFYFTAEWNCNWQVALDNRVDPIHGSFLHAGTFTLGHGRRDAELKVEPTENGFQTYRDNQRGVNIDWHEVRFYPGNILCVTTEIPNPPTFGGGCFRINGCPTPIDENHTYVSLCRSRQVSGWRRDLWRFLYKNRLEAQNFIVVEQDRTALEAIPLEARRREKLIQTDIAVGRMRRLVRQEAEHQLAEVRARATNPARTDTPPEKSLVTARA